MKSWGVEMGMPRPSVRTWACDRHGGKQRSKLGAASAYRTGTYLANTCLSPKLAIWKTYRIGTRDRRDNHPGVYLREERQVQFIDYRLKPSMFYKNVSLKSTGRSPQKTG